MNKAYGLVELLMAFLILTVIVASCMQMTLSQMQAIKDKDNAKTSPQHVIVEDFNNTLDKIEEAKELKLKHEQQINDSWPR